MTRKTMIFICGVSLLSAGWLFVTNSVQMSQKQNIAETSSAKFDLLQSRIERLSGFDAVVEGELKKPAKFMFNFVYLNNREPGPLEPSLVLAESKAERGLYKGLSSQAKETFLDQNEEASFFTLDLEENGRFLIRAQKSIEGVELVGFALDGTLNYLGQGLEQTDWFLVDSRNNVLASSEKAYVGKSHKLNDNFLKSQFQMSDHKYRVAMVRPSTINLALVNVFGLAGIFFVTLALYLYARRFDGEKRIGQFDYYTPEALQNVELEEKVKEQAGGAPAVSPDVFDEHLSEDMRIMDLATNQDSPKTDFDYTDFLMDNPVLKSGEQKPNDPKTEKINRDQASQEVTNEDWVKLAEELSDNIDKFTQELEADKGQKQNQAES